jgi:molecular chaperone DnaK
MPKEFEGKISDDDKKVIDEAVAEAKKHLESDDKDELEKAANELLEKIQGIGAKLYEAAAKEEAADEDKKSDDKDEPVEGEVVEDDGKKGKK